MKRLMRWLRLYGISMLGVLAASGCKKVAPDEVKVDQSYSQVTTFVGSGGTGGGYSDGTGKLTAFSYMAGIAMDATGNLYVNDQNNFRIRKITSAGVVTTFAGSGVNGYTDGTGTAAQFSYLEGMIIDASGNLYVSDYGNSVIRKITPSGVVSTYAGTGHAGMMDGPVATAQFSNPAGLTIDKTGNLYVGDSGNFAVRKISAGGIVSTYAGVPGTPNYYPSRFNGRASDLTFGPNINGLALDAAGNLYVSDRYSNFIQKITPEGDAVTWAGDGTTQSSGIFPYRDGFRLTAEFNSQTYMSIDAVGNLYIADQANNRIRKITPDGNVSTLAGNDKAGEVDGRVPDAQLRAPIAVTTNADGSIVYFTEYNRICRIDNITTYTKPQNSWNNPQSWGNPN
ncbi:hypothetical protein [Pedobacter sp. UYP1]|uniref:NHL domain-containing protein n=1 Tax=Pedobacter sp. UYP1 TaxID=1756396 RepID=UPI00339191D2